jgi:hypothetical protein
MRVCRALLAFALLLSGCVTAGVERVDIVIFNDTPSRHPIQIEIDGHSFFDGEVMVPQSEPTIVAHMNTNLSTGRHRVNVTCDKGTRSLDFEVRAGTRTTVQIHVRQDGVTVDVAYGERVYI